MCSRSLQWERGLKFDKYMPPNMWFGRSLQWERGLKLVMPLVQFAFLLSFPVLGTQIEMINVWNCHMVRTGSFNIGRMLQTDY